MPGNKDVYVLAETTEDGRPSYLSLELMGLGRELSTAMGGRLCAVLLGDGVGEAAEELSRYGADEVFAVDDESLAPYNPEVYLAVLEEFVKDKNPELLMAGHTMVGQDLLPRLAFSLGAGLVTDCVGLRVEGEELRFTRPIYGGNALATQRVETDTSLATVRARVGEAPPAGEAGKVTHISPAGVAEPRVSIRGREREDRGECPLEEAHVVVSGGRGMGGGEGFEALRELASLFGGAVGASRPPVDSGWAPTTCQVGITGKVVAPDLYFAVAISGSSQHLSGMGESGKIVAINRDPEAYIFSVSDYGVVGDWKQVVPVLTARLRELLGE